MITVEAPENRLRTVSLHDFLAMEIPPREHILAPWLPTQGLTMLYAKRGIGKTHMGLGVAFAVASGGKFLKWVAPKPRKVLFIDGEMPAVALQERLAALVAGTETEPPSADYLRIITPDLQERGIPDIGSEDGQAAIEEHLDGVELVILDNLSTLARIGKENESESWLPIQEWVLGLRRRGYCGHVHSPRRKERSATRYVTAGGRTGRRDLPEEPQRL